MCDLEKHEKRVVVVVTGHMDKDKKPKGLQLEDPLDF